ARADLSLDRVNALRKKSSKALRVVFLAHFHVLDFPKRIPQSRERSWQTTPHSPLWCGHPPLYISPEDIMFLNTLHQGRPRNPRRSSRQRGRANSLRAANFKPQLETLEERSVLSTIAYQVPANTVGQQAFSGPLGLDFDVKQNVVVGELGVF